MSWLLEVDAFTCLRLAQPCCCRQGEVSRYVKIAVCHTTTYRHSTLHCVHYCHHGLGCNTSLMQRRLGETRLQSPQGRQSMLQVLTSHLRQFPRFQLHCGQRITQCCQQRLLKGAQYSPDDSPSITPVKRTCVGDTVGSCTVDHQDVNCARNRKLWNYQQARREHCRRAERRH